ncbi:MAG: DUF2892 domain-containing protein [Paracoccaceae bacterium]
MISGILLIAAALASGIAIFDASLMKYGAVIVGVVLVATGLMRNCLLYSIVGIKTCKA